MARACPLTARGRPNRPLSHRPNLPATFIIPSRDRSMSTSPPPARSAMSSSPRAGHWSSGRHSGLVIGHSAPLPRLAHRLLNALPHDQTPPPGLLGLGLLFHRNLHRILTLLRPPHAAVDRAHRFIQQFRAPDQPSAILRTIIIRQQRRRRAHRRLELLPQCPFRPCQASPPHICILGISPHPPERDAAILTLYRPTRLIGRRFRPRPRCVTRIKGFCRPRMTSPRVGPRCPI